VDGGRCSPSTCCEHKRISYPRGSFHVGLEGDDCRGDHGGIVRELRHDRDVWGSEGPQPRQPSSPRVSSESSWEMKGWANAPRSSQMFKMRLSCSFSCVVHRSQTFSNAFGRAPRKASVSDVSFFLDCRMMSLAKNMYFIFFCGVSFSSSESHICGEIWTPCNLHKRECFVMMMHDPHGERLY
jgi:hypothetical protein